MGCVLVCPTGSALVCHKVSALSSYLSYKQCPCVFYKTIFLGVLWTVPLCVLCATISLNVLSQSADSVYFREGEEEGEIVLKIVFLA